MQAGTSNRTAIRIVKETAFNETPATPAFENLRYTGESVAYAPRSVTSNEIRDDRMTADMVQVGAEVSGDLQVELSFASFDSLIAAALCTSWPAPDVNGDSTIKNGVETHSFTLQKHFQDLAIPSFQMFTGCRVGGMSLDFQTGSILTGSFSFMGCSASVATAQIAGATFTSPGDGNVPFNAVSNLVGLEKDDIALTTNIRSMTLELNNNLRGQEAIGTMGYVGIALGRLEITGGIEMYFENLSEYQTFLDNADFKLEFVLQDADSNSYKFTLPRIKYEEGTILSGGSDQDLMVSGTWRALYDSVTDCMIQIDRHDEP